MFFQRLYLLSLGATLTFAQRNCPGYTASNIQQSATGLTADLTLAGEACNVYGFDLTNLTLTVEYQSGNRLHVLIQDQNQSVYQVPTDIFPGPESLPSASASNSNLRFTFTQSPFSFAVARSDGETLFNTSGNPLVFENQYLNVRTSLPDSPNLYGLGEHSDPFRLNTTNYTRTIWNRDSYGIPAGTNLYGAHPIYVEHRGESGTHGVVFVNSNGIEVKINDTQGQYLEYNTLGGVFDFYFLAGPSPVEVSQQIAEVVGLPANIPYGGLGFHQCRYGYRDIYEVAGVVYNYSQAGIALETMWTDIDYMFRRYVMTVDPDRFPMAKVRELVNYLHAHQQKYTVMVDPAVAYQPNTGYGALDSGIQQDIFLKTSNGSLYTGVVWPGPTVFPDWFSPNAQTYWTGQFDSFFSPETGIDIDYLWIDMNEAANFCNWPCSDPQGYAEENNFPPDPPPVRNSSPIALPGFPADFQPPSSSARVKRQDNAGLRMGLSGRDLINPPYQIRNAAGSLSNKTINTDLVHYNGLVEYDTHNLYGTMMSNHSRNAMLSRRPQERTLVITRSTFLGAGTYVAHWLGDNISDWPHYRISIAQMLAFSAFFSLPITGSDVCGFGGNTTELLCARWMMLGAFYPFYRNHNELGSVSQEAYRWESVAESARRAIDIRYRMLDYFYTAVYEQTVDGTPSLNPMFYVYPNDSNTFGIDLQYFWGSSVLISPVTEENGTSVDIYLPQDIFYDWNNGFTPVQGSGTTVTLYNVDFQTIPIHIKGGSVLPLRARSANTTTELRKQPFQIVIAPGTDGTASGSLYIDDGISLEQAAISYISFSWDGSNFSMNGTYDYSTGVNISQIILLGQRSAPSGAITGDQYFPVAYNSTSQVASVNVSIPLTGDSSMRFGQVASYTGNAFALGTNLYLAATALLLILVAAQNL
ncbi:hypothetical protein LTS08_001284 [Lithohypha guttulata]|nr:hypothetical protein LTS08_001284 [Lithohypha guttulata]